MLLNIQCVLVEPISSPRAQSQIYAQTPFCIARDYCAWTHAMSAHRKHCTVVHTHHTWPEHSHQMRNAHQRTRQRARPSTTVRAHVCLTMCTCVADCVEFVLRLYEYRQIHYRCFVFVCMCACVSASVALRCRIESVSLLPWSRLAVQYSVQILERKIETKKHTQWL